MARLLFDKNFPDLSQGDNLRIPRVKSFDEPTAQILTDAIEAFLAVLLASPVNAAFYIKEAN